MSCHAVGTHKRSREVYCVFQGKRDRPSGKKLWEETHYFEDPDTLREYMKQPITVRQLQKEVFLCYSTFHKPMMYTFLAVNTIVGKLNKTCSVQLVLLGAGA